MRSATLTESGRPTVADFYRINRGGGLFSEVDQPVARRGRSPPGPHRLRLRPTALTLANLVLGLATSVIVVALRRAGSPPGTYRPGSIGLVALVGWQVAYALDCADGQLARVTGQGSAAGARVDVLCDVAAQIALVTALAAVAVAQRPATPVWLVAVVRRHLDGQPGDLGDAGRPERGQHGHLDARCRCGVVKLVRDYGAVIFAGRRWCSPRPRPGRSGLMVAFTVVNGGFLLASIAFSARASLR